VIKVYSLQSYAEAPDNPGEVFVNLQKTVEWFPNENFNNELECDSIAFVDPWLKALGIRILCPENSCDVPPNMTQY